MIASSLFYRKQDDRCVAKIRAGVFVMVMWVGFLPATVAQNLEGLRQQKPMIVSGSLSARAIFYGANGIANRREPFSYILTGNPVLSFYNTLVVPLSFTYSEQDRAFRQPFNQFGMSPYYKWLKVHAGYRNITFSQFTLAGHTFLGGGFEANPGMLRAGFIYGRFNRATPVDTLSKTYQPYTYANFGFAAKIGVGKGSNFIDASVVKAHDVANSVTLPANLKGAVTAGENLVVGLNGQVRFLKMFTYSLEVATSIYTRDRTAESNVPPANDGIIKAAGKYMVTNATTERYNAWQTSIAFQQNKTSVRVQYRRVDPDYKSMGAYFFNNDLENVTVAPGTALLKGKLRVSGSIGFQHDNLNKQKQTTSHRVISSANVSADITERLGVDFSYSNYSNTQQRHTVLLQDSFRIVQVSQNFSLTPRYIVATEKRVHALVVSANYNLFSSVDKSVDTNSDTKAYNAFVNYQITLVPTNLTLSGSLNYTDVKSASFEQGNYGLTLGVNKIFDNKLTAGWNGSFLKGLNTQNDGLILNQSLLLSYKVTKHHTFGVNLSYINNRSQQLTYAPSYSEWKGDVNYRYIF